MAKNFMFSVSEITMVSKKHYELSSQFNNIPNIIIKCFF